MTKDLYNPKDVAEVRNKLLKEQDGKDLLTGLDIPLNQACLDHSHDENQYVRGVLHRQSNAVLGKIENLWTRYLGYWYEGSLSGFLRLTADYIDREDDTRYRHNGWIKKVKTKFNKLNAEKQNKVLMELGGTQGKNPAERKKLFAKVVLDRRLGYEKIMEVLDATL